MKLRVLLVSLFWGLILVDTSVAENTDTLQSCFPDMCNLLAEVGALKEKLGAVEAKLEDSKNQIRELKNKEHTPVIFSAETIGSGPIENVTTHTMVYRRPKTNIGAAYYPPTGIFTAPVKGVYYFTFFYYARGINTVTLVLVRNEQFIAAMHAHETSEDGGVNGGNAVFVPLQQGDRVFVRLMSDSQILTDTYVSTFSGFLVSKT